MIGTDMPFESAESRPIIVNWMTHTLFVISIFLLLASFLALFASVKQLRQTQSFYAIKPAGDVYRVRIFSDVKEAASEAKRVTTRQAAAAMPTSATPTR